MDLIGDIPGLGWTAMLHGTPLVIFWVIATLLVLFVGVALRSFWLAFTLSKIANQIVQQGNKAELLDLPIFKSKEPYRHLWSEYQDTLHQLRRKDGGTEYRATLPAEAFFTKETLVDNRAFVWNDFFRHLPGILTGLGIIGTFAGLITGLEGFSPSDDASATRVSLKTLMDGVQEAFSLSAFAITSAIVVTFLEKSSLAWAYKNVEKLTQAIDMLYEAGAGEEYLARLVEADEANAAQTAQLKDSLVNDLRVLLTELTERQIKVQQESNQLLNQSIIEINSSLGTVNNSLGSLHNTFAEKASTDTGHIKGALDDLMTTFIEGINNTLGQQMQAIRDSMQQSSQTMQGVEQSLNGLVNRIAQTTHGVMEDVMTQMENAMQRSANAQEQMTQRIGDFVAQMRNQMQTQQQASNEAIQQMLAEILQTTQNVQRESNQSLQDNLQSIAAYQNTQREHLKNDIDALVKRVGEAITAMQENINRLSNTTTDAISGMNLGAEKMKSAATDFVKAGQSVSGVLDKATPIATQMLTSTTTLGKASQQLIDLFSQYKNIRDETTRQIQSLQNLLDTIKQEAAIKKELINDIERITVVLRATEQQSMEYLEKVNGVLVQSFQDFGNAMTNQVAQSINQTDQHLTQGVNLLSGVVQELGAQLQQMRQRG